MRGGKELTYKLPPVLERVDRPTEERTRDPAVRRRLDVHIFFPPIPRPPKQLLAISSFNTCAHELKLYNIFISKGEASAGITLEISRIASYSYMCVYLFVNARLKYECNRTDELGSTRGVCFYSRIGGVGDVLQQK